MQLTTVLMDELPLMVSGKNLGVQGLISAEVFLCVSETPLYDM